MVYHQKFDSVAFAVSGTPGTGSITVGAALDNQSFTPAERSIPTGFVGHWRIEDGTDVEIVEGTYSSSGPTITRDRVMESKIAGVPGTTKLTLTSSAIVRLVDSAEEWNEMYAETMARSALAKIVASQTDYVKTFTYDVRKDSDGGFWTDQCSHTSWWNEAASATRGARRSFPKIADIVLRSGASSTTGVLQIFDRTDLDETGKPRLWMSFNCTAGGFALYGNASATLNSVFAINGRIYVTSGTASGGFTIIDFPNDRTSVMFDTTMLWYPHTIAERNTTIAISVAGAYPAGLVSSQCLGVHARAIGTTVDAMGLVIPTVAVATAAGGSVILPSGSVWDVTYAGGFKDVKFISDTRLWFSRADADGFFAGAIPTADISSTSWIAAAGAQYRDSVGDLRLAPGSTALLLAKGAAGHDGGVTRVEEVIAAPGNGMVSYIAIAYATGWMAGDTRLATLCDVATGNLVGAELVTNGDFSTDLTGWSIISGSGGGGVAQSAGTASITSGTSGASYLRQTWTTVIGQVYQVTFDVATTNVNISVGTALGAVDIYPNTVFSVGVGRTFQFIATSTTTYFQAFKGGGVVVTTNIDNVSCKIGVADRSYKAKGLIAMGTITRTAVASGADMVAHSGFSTSNYYEQPYNSDLDFGTGPALVAAWVKLASAGTQLTLICRDSATTGARLLLYLNASGAPRFLVSGGTNSANAAAANGIADGQWHLLVGIDDGTTAKLLVDGVLVASAASTAVGSLSNAAAILRVGLDAQGANPATGVSLAMARLSAYAATDAQIAQMFRDERALFLPDAKCVLGGTSISVSDLDYDEDAKELAVATGDGVSIFNGLRRVAYLDNSIFVGASDTIRGVSARAGNRSIVTSAEYIAQSDKQYRNDDNSMAAAQARIRLDLSTEIAARSAADSANAASISAEATARGNADTTLQNNINTLSNTVTYGKLVGLSYGHGIP